SAGLNSHALVRYTAAPISGLRTPRKSFRRLWRRSAEASGDDWPKLLRPPLASPTEAEESLVPPLLHPRPGGLLRALREHALAHLPDAALLPRAGAVRAPLPARGRPAAHQAPGRRQLVEVVGRQRDARRGAEAGLMNILGLSFYYHDSSAAL